MRIRFQTVAEQVASCLREELLGGRWGDKLPGLRPLSSELGVDPKTVQIALAQLEREGVLRSEGPRRPRRITVSERQKSPNFRVGILLHQATDREKPFVMEIRHRLFEAGHAPFFAPKSLMEMSMNLTRVGSVVQRSEADAWIVISGSEEMLHWFSEQPTPTFALFGGMWGQRIAGSAPAMQEAFRMVTRRLLEWGHRRIVYLTDAPSSHSKPGLFRGVLLEELEAAGVATGPYNVSRWGGSPDEIRGDVDRLFAATPPTALIIDGTLPFITIQQHLGRKGVLAPESVSLVCTEADRSFGWQEPQVAHIEWSFNQMVRRVVRWTDNAARGKVDHRKTFPKARFIDGGTIGPVPKRSRRTKAAKG